MSWGTEEESRHRRAAASGMEVQALDLLVRMLRLPLAFFAFGAEAAAGALREMERWAAEGVGCAASGAAEPVCASARHERELPGGAGRWRAPGPGASKDAALEIQTGGRGTADTRVKERTTMPETNLSDDMVKLVRYSIVSIKRDDEKVLHRDEEVFDDNMTDDAFATWVISKYGDARGMSSEDRKYLRVSYEVLGRWPKQDRKYEKRQLEVLEGIRKALE